MRRPIRVLLYIDSVAMLSHCVTAAELIRKELGAHIIMMVVDAKKHIDETIKNYEVYDYGSLFSVPQKFVTVWPPVEEKTRGARRLFGIGLQKLLRSPSVLAASQQIGSQSKFVQALVLPPLFILIMTYRALRFVRNNLRRLPGRSNSGNAYWLRSVAKNACGPVKQAFVTAADERTPREWVS